MNFIGLKVRRKKQYCCDDWSKVCKKYNKNVDDIFTISKTSTSIHDIRIEEFKESHNWFFEYFDIVKPKKDHFPTWW